MSPSTNIFKCFLLLILQFFGEFTCFSLISESGNFTKKTVTRKIENLKRFAHREPNQFHRGLSCFSRPPKIVSQTIKPQEKKVVTKGVALPTHLTVVNQFVFFADKLLHKNCINSHSGGRTLGRCASKGPVACQSWPGQPFFMMNDEGTRSFLTRPIMSFLMFNVFGIQFLSPIFTSCTACFFVWSWDISHVLSLKPIRMMMKLLLCHHHYTVDAQFVGSKLI